jgi:NADP-dependent 3-hydroxy acid dehydrogenase YdfG
MKTAQIRKDIMQDLTGKVVFVTGASAGIGQSCARLFARRGCKLILAARRQKSLKKLADTLETDCHTLELDVRDADAVAAAVKNLPAGFREVDILVNNAGLSRGLDRLHEGKLQDWEEMIDTNVKGLLYVSRAVIPGMVQRGRGHVINVGSIAGREVYPRGNVYCATKFAVDALTKGMRLDLIDTPVRVSTVDPGLVQTEFSEVRFRGDTERAEQVYQNYTPLSPDDVAEAVVWIADRPQHVTIGDILILPTDQASATMVHKTEEGQ